MTKLGELKQQMETMRLQVLEASKTAFNETTKVLFEKYPKLKYFSWRQYTPYFNDGDECVFHAHTGDLDYYWGEEKIEDVSDWTFKYDGTEAHIKGDVDFKSCHEEIQAMFKDIDEPFMKQMFGDHVKIQARKDGVEIEEYSHD